jgi:hypothetical protein
MAATLIETVRLVHEDMAVHRNAAVQELLVEHKLTKDVIIQETKVQRHVKHIAASAQRLLKLYEDADGLRAQEVAEITASPADPMSVFTTFYERLLATREYHRRFPNAAIKSAEGVRLCRQAAPLPIRSSQPTSAAHRESLLICLLLLLSPHPSSRMVACAG